MGAIAHTNQSQVKPCDSCRLLSEQFATAARLHSEAVALLTANAPNRPRHEYIRLRDAAEEARRRSESARVAFERHVDSHHHTAAQAALATA